MIPLSPFRFCGKTGRRQRYSVTIRPLPSARGRLFFKKTGIFCQTLAKCLIIGRSELIGFIVGAGEGPRRIGDGTL